MRKAFTIIELVLVMIVIGVLASLVLISYSGISQKANIASLQSDLANASNLLKAYNAQYGSYPLSVNCSNTQPTEICLKASSSTTFNYVPGQTTAPYTYSLIATNGTLKYQATSSSSPELIPARVLDGTVLYVDAGDTASYNSSTSGTTWTDLSSNNYNGTLVNGPVFSAANSGSLNFDGVDDYVDAGSLPISNAYTICAWVKFNKLTNGSVDQNAYGFSIAGVSLLGSGYPLWLAAGGPYPNEVILRAFSTTTNNNVTTGANLKAGAWFYIVATATSGTNAKVYVNSVEKLSYTPESNPWTGSFVISDLRPARMLGIDGYISSVQLYNRVLSQSEISQNFNALRGRYGL